MRPDDYSTRLGYTGEQAVEQWLRTSGYYVVRTHAIAGGAPMLLGEIQRYVLPDFQVAKDGRAQWVEVKTKDYAPFYAIAQEHRTGVDLPRWDDYLRVERETGIPGALAIVQIRPGPMAAPAPVLLMAPFRRLRSHVQIYAQSTQAFPHGMAFFPVDAFDRFHNIDQYIRTQTPPIPRVIRPWERGLELGHRQLLMDFDP